MKLPRLLPPKLRKPFASIRFRLLVVNLLVLAIPSIGAGFAHFYEREMLRELETDMIHQGQVLAAELQRDPAGLELSTREPMLRAIARQTRTRIRLLDASGHLVADSHRGGPPEGEEAQPPRLSLSYAIDSLENERPRGAGRSTTPADDISQRPEVKRALAGHYGAATRIYVNGHRLYLFSALPVLGPGRRVEAVVYLTRSSIPVLKAMYRLRTSLIKLFAGALAATLLLTLFLAATLSRPLEHLTRVASALARQDRSRRLELSRDDEIGELARAFQALTDRLDARAHDVAELASNLSHELKSPLTSIRGAAELLLDGAADDPAARTRFLRNMLADSQRLDRLVTRLLELSRLEADPAPNETCDFESIVREACARTSPGAPIDVRYEAQRREVQGRRAHLVSALGNLVDNARQHAKPDTRVTVRVVDTDGGLATTVHNVGPVISPANLSRIWDRFFTTRAAEGGSGLGLPIVRQVARAHGGEVSVECSAERGTTFTLTLP